MKPDSLINQFGKLLADELQKGRISSKLGLLTMTPSVVIYVWIYKFQNTELALNIILGVMFIQLLIFMILIGLETRKARHIPKSVLISIGLGLGIVMTMAALKTTQGDAVLIAALIYMILFGSFGLASAMIGIGTMRKAKV